MLFKLIEKLFIELSFIIILFTVNAFAQNEAKIEDYLKINAGGNDPLYSTYAASLERSRLYGDKAYKMDYYTLSEPLNYSSDHAGRIFVVWMIDKLVIDRIEKYYKKPIVKYSFPDMAVIEYQPLKGINVHETFFVYGSSIALVDLQIENTGDVPHSVNIFPALDLGKDSLVVDGFDRRYDAYMLNHYESKWRLISSLYKNAPYPTQLRDVFTISPSSYSHGAYPGALDDFYLKIKTDYYADDLRSDSLNFKSSGYSSMAVLHSKFELEPGAKKNIRYLRGIQDQSEDTKSLLDKLDGLKTESLKKYFDENVKLLSNIPRIQFKCEDEKLMYLGALNLARGCMLPPSGKTSYNFYVFSRNPLWGWGHGHQVLHESLSMMAYAYLDWESAQNSERVYIEQQENNGLIAYRHGPRGAQTYPHNGKPTTSAPFFSWINWEIYTVSKDKIFLKEAFNSGEKYVNWLIENRDTDHDSTFEWGPYGLIENVRDWYNVIFQVSDERHLDVDKEDISDELECLDLTSMIINEMRSLSQMADELGYADKAVKWRQYADKISQILNERMWDEKTKFYYHVDKKNHSFEFLGRDLKRMEIIGFLPLWAEAATEERAEMLVEHLTDVNKFWRKYGVPTLAADDEWYSPYVDYCCKWNGPVWMLWDYMVFRGLLNYGFNDIALELASKMLLAASTQLSINHNYWESYSPDNTVLDCPSNYIWDAIIAKLLIEVNDIRNE